MNYRRLYNSVIQNAKSQKRLKHSGVYFEKHHILPRSLGGDNSKDNTVLLTAREHFLAHWLLWKIEEGEAKNKMAYAFFKMCRKSEFRSTRPSTTGYKYEIARKANAVAMRNLHLDKVVSKETRQKMSIFASARTGEKNSFFGKTHTVENKRKQSERAKVTHKGEGNPNVKIWNIKFPDGDVKSIKCLKQFCANLGVSVYKMRTNSIPGYEFIGEAT